MKKVALILFVTLASIASWSQPVSAHVFFTDESGKSGVIMHVLPDDDPIAGSSTQMFFDLQDEALNTRTHIYSLYIINDDTPGPKSPAATYVQGDQAVSATYAFPVQGSYTLELAAQPIYNLSDPYNPRDPVVFRYSQRVSRGATNSPLDQPRYAWAEFGLILTGCGIVVLLIVVVSRRVRIARFTKRY